MFFKILDEDLIHYGFEYHKGLNIDSNTFDPNAISGNGLFFADEENILGFCDFGTKIATVSVPDGEQIVPIHGVQYKSHQIIIQEIMDLWTIETFRWLIKQGVNIHAWSDNVIRWAAYDGNLELIKYLIELGVDIHAYNDDALYQAILAGHMDVVKYLIELGAIIDDNCLQVAIQEKNVNLYEYFITELIPICN